MIQFIRLDKVYFANLQEAHLIAIGVMLMSVTFLVWKTRFKTVDEVAAGPTDDEGPGSPTTSGPGRRRRQRAERRARAKAKAG